MKGPIFAIFLKFRFPVYRDSCLEIYFIFPVLPLLIAENKFPFVTHNFFETPNGRLPTITCDIRRLFGFWYSFLCLVYFLLQIVLVMCCTQMRGLVYECASHVDHSTDAPSVTKTLVQATCITQFGLISIQHSSPQFLQLFYNLSKGKKKDAMF